MSRRCLYGKKEAKWSSHLGHWIGQPISLRLPWPRRLFMEDADDLA
jgi:hypothetical protein